LETVKSSDAHYFIHTSESPVAVTASLPSSWTFAFTGD